MSESDLPINRGSDVRIEVEACGNPTVLEGVPCYKDPDHPGACEPANAPAPVTLESLFEGIRDTLPSQLAPVLPETENPDDYIQLPGGHRMRKLPHPSADVFTQIECSVESKPLKVSRTTSNIANKLEAQFPPSVWPELMLPNVWISGSRVWCHLYGEEPNPDADLDVFATDAVAYERLKLKLELEKTSVEPTIPRLAQNRSHARGYGCKITTDRGPIDIWLECDNAIDQIGTYPLDGYAHCRAAYSVGRGILMVAPNDRAEPAPVALAIAPKRSRLARARAWIKGFLDKRARLERWAKRATFGLKPEVRPVDLMIGRLDRLLSEFLVAAEDPNLDEADRQTLKHHADDLIGVGNAALRKVAK